MEAYIKPAKNIKQVTNPSDNTFIITMELPKKSFIKIEKALNRRKVNSQKLDCINQINLCRIMSANKGANINHYIFKKTIYYYNPSWLLYKEQGILGAVSFPIDIQLYKRYMNSFNPEVYTFPLDVRIFKKFVEKIYSII